MAVKHFLVTTTINRGEPNEWLNQFAACDPGAKELPARYTKDRAAVTCKSCMKTYYYDPIKYGGRW